ncbi:lipoprotein [Photobacterium gaetbulicola]|uniref:Lipoprotein n=1 Tax=Photobacterium gaetbulicola TaxID=1295392 RepID=A0A0B9G8C8_9GAMM|nr:lipoprotein [Photobacterium gaetbulicola]KHT64973.1 lipoprotein [Photobacterium gaetbulicola]
MLKHAVVAVLSFGLVACANLSTQSLFSHYSAANSKAHQAMQQGLYQQAMDVLPDAPAGEILDGMERGRVGFVAGHYPQSFGALQAADSAVKEQQHQARIQVSEGFNQVGSLLTNDNMITYRPADYELGFLHLYLALNYLQQRNLEGALVEVRRANQVQEAAKRQREDELAKAAKEARRKGLDQNLGAVLARYPDVGSALGNIQNGYLFFLSGVLYEADGDLNSAYIDYKRALAVAPENPFVAETVLRLATRMRMDNDLPALQARYGKYQPPSASTGRVIVFDEQGVVSARDDWRLPIWLTDSRGDGVIYNLTLPYYRTPSNNAFTPLQLNGKPLVDSTVADVDGMARYSLQEDLPMIVLRQALRVAAKNEVRKTAAREANDVGNVLTNIFNTLTEQPDTRSWQSLPASVSIAQQDVAAGHYDLAWNGHQIDVDVQAGRTTMVWVSRQGNQLTGWSVLLGGN